MLYKREQTQDDLTVAEFFAGIGLMRLGLEQAGWRILYANDISTKKKDMYEGHFGIKSSHFDATDVHVVKGMSVPSTLLATASFPCTDLSLAGGRSGLSGKESSAFWGFMRVVEEMGARRPQVILLENVVGFISSNSGTDFYSALSAMNKLGYEVDAFIIDAAHFVPQSRRRLFVVGSKPSLDRSKVVSAGRQFFESQHRPRALANFILDHPDINWSIRTLPALPVLKEKLSNLIEKIDHKSDLWWSRDRVEYFVSQMSDKHYSTLEAQKKKRKWSYCTAFRRVRGGKTMAEIRTDGIAGCLRTSKGGSAKQILIKVGYDKVFVRHMTPRECASLMGAPGFKIDVPINQALFGFGDAVCVPVISWIASNYLNPLVGICNAPSKFKNIA